MFALAGAEDFGVDPTADAPIGEETNKIAHAPPRARNAEEFKAWNLSSLGCDERYLVGDSLCDLFR